MQYKKISGISKSSKPEQCSGIQINGMRITKRGGGILGESNYIYPFQNLKTNLYYERKE
jgi:hypothetical protein